MIIAAIIVNILLQDRASSESWDIRMMDYISGLNSWLSSPILGIGYGKTSNIFSTGYLTQQVGYSNSLFLILSIKELAEFIPLISYQMEKSEALKK